MKSNKNISKIELYAEEFSNSCCNDMFKTAVIKKLPNGKWTVVSLKGKNLGEYDSKDKATLRLKQIEYWKSHKKKASKDNNYSFVMRELRKSHDDDTVKNFQLQYKKLFDEALLSGNEEPGENILEEAMQCISQDISIYDIEKIASAIELGDPEFAGRYLADLVKFLVRRISPDRRPKSIDSLKKKIYYINEYSIAAKKVPNSSSMGQSITLLKTILLEHSPEYIRKVLNSVVRNL